MAKSSLKVRALIVDDEQGIADLLKDEIEELSAVKCATVYRADDALALFSDSPFQIVIADQKMPGMTGVELLRQIREKKPDTIRMLMSGYSEFKILHNAINECGVSGFIAKPWQVTELKIMIDAAVERLVLGHQNRQLLLDLERQNGNIVKMAESLEQSFFHTIQLLTDVMAEVSADLTQHSRQTAALCVEVASTLRLTQKQRRNLEIAALLHDLALIGLPREIFTTHPMRLSGHLRGLFAQHTDVGADMLKAVPRLNNICKIIRLHHENIDGSGLLANSGPLSSEVKVLRVCDYYDEAIFLRGEKRQFVVGYMKRRQGSWFDGVALDALFDVISRHQGPLLLPLQVEQLELGMQLGRALESTAGQMLLPSGTVLTPLNLQRIQNFHRQQQIEEVFVHRR